MPEKRVDEAADALAAREPGRVAEVLIDSPVPHLDRPFDYAVPAGQHIEPGMRVRVPFSGRTADGLVTACKESTGHDGELAEIGRAIAAFPLVTGEQLTLFGAVADRYAGTRSDVLRLALPPRHARTEERVLAEPGSAAAPEPPGERDLSLWSDYAGGRAFIGRLAAGAPSGPARPGAPVPRAAAALLPGDDESGPADLLAVAAKAAAAAGRSALIVAPDYRDLDRLAEALTRRVGPDKFVRLSADEGNAERYGAYLRVLRGTRRIVIGTRAAMFAPVSDIGLLALLEDGDDLLDEPRAPYPHPREVLLMRSAASAAPILFAGHSRSTDVQRLVENGYLVDLRAARATVRARAPRIVAPDDSRPGDGGRLPASAFRIVRRALGMDRSPNAAGPVLVQVPRAGYAPLLTCGSCRKAARCAGCRGPLEQRDAESPPSCRWCGRPVAAFACPDCGGTELRRSVIGAGRTGEELGRAFPGVKMVRSSGDHVLGTVPPGAAIVVATVGAEPVVPGGYAAALLLDGNSLISLPGLRAGEQALRRWLAAAALVRPAPDGGTVFIGADEERTVGALVRWDPVGYAERELAERRELSMPPAVRMAALSGPAAALNDVADEAGVAGDGVSIIGPAPIPDTDDSRTLVFFGYSRTDVPRQLRAALAARSARRAAEPVRARVDDTGSL
ncbi:hypothetical protein [Spelaeicoccus albus]|uniref:Probable replication restart protein PriA n=1 Tax=Spelaeicoccus albus TaxID=1280376 RepID=A0A7Z0IIK2_9MICO|nr:hypothetical protein [Spelaeicoccus albus]NYI68598.1 primosomal protein N' (replication factor Y) [Spelaeicoccus albus]